MSVEASVNQRLAALTAAGTSVWLDQIRRGLITSGELERLVREDSLRGVTSNPAIFEKAILGSTDYDEQLDGAGRAGARPAPRSTRRSRSSTCRSPATSCAPSGTTPAAPTASSRSRSSPRSRTTRDLTIEQARDFWGRVDRPNLMIKIPGTDEGVPAIEEAIAAGINVNVTLLFSVESYTAIAEAYIRGMERRLEAGESMDVHSVASFFVSRVDTEVDKRLEALGREDLRGIAAIANARAAYEKLQGALPRRALRARCARPAPRCSARSGPRPASRTRTTPRPSTWTPWSAPHTVNTMPMATLRACAEQLEVTGPTARPGPDRRPEGARRRRHRHGRRDQEAPARRHRRSSWSRSTRCWRASSSRARAWSPAARPRSSRRSRTSSSRRSPSGSSRRAPRTWSSASGRKDESLWGGPGVPEIGEPAGLADDHRQDARARRRARASSSSRCAPTASPTWRCSAWAARASAPR